MFGAGNNGLINPPQANRLMKVSQADIAVFDDDVYELLMDLTVLIEQAKVTNSSSLIFYCSVVLEFLWQVCVIVSVIVSNKVHYMIWL